MYTYELNGVERRLGEFRLQIDGLRLEPGGIYAAVGPNGCGKTTFLSLLALLDQPSEGHILFRGERVEHTDVSRVLQWRRGIAYLMQNPYLFNTSVYDNIAYGLVVRRVPKREISGRVDAVMERLGLLPLAHRRAHALSGGEAQRVALARTLVLGGDVVLLDEPTASVDQRHVRNVEDIIREINRGGTTVVLTTHSRDQAARLASRQISIIGGAIHDIAYENVFEGRATDDATGLQTLPLSRSTSIRLTQGWAGDLTVAIDPQDIILSNSPFASSALNQFRGPIRRVEEADGSLRVFVDVAPVLCALVTRQSFLAMDINVGKEVWLTFKANAVKVIR